MDLGRRGRQGLHGIAQRRQGTWLLPPLARRRSRRQVILETHADKYSPVYEVKVTTVAAGTKSVATAKNAFAGWFDQQGYFVENPFRAFIRNAVPVLAEDAAGKK